MYTLPSCLLPAWSPQWLQETGNGAGLWLPSGLWTRKGSLPQTSPYLGLHLQTRWWEKSDQYLKYCLLVPRSKSMLKFLSVWRNTGVEAAPSALSTLSSNEKETKNDLRVCYLSWETWAQGKNRPIHWDHYSWVTESEDCKTNSRKIPVSLSSLLFRFILAVIISLVICDHRDISHPPLPLWSYFVTERLAEWPIHPSVTQLDPPPAESHSNWLLACPNLTPLFLSCSNAQRAQNGIKLGPCPGKVPARWLHKAGGFLAFLSAGWVPLWKQFQSLNSGCVKSSSSSFGAPEHWFPLLPRLNSSMYILFTQTQC